MRVLLSHLFSWAARAQAATVVAGTEFQGAALANVPSVGVDTASHSGG